MSEKSSHNDGGKYEIQFAIRSDEDSSSSDYSQSKEQGPQKQQQVMLPPEPAQPQRRRADTADEPWTLPFASPGFPNFQLQPTNFPQISSLPNFNLNKPGTTEKHYEDNLFEEYPDLMNDQRRQPNPFRKVSGPVDMLACQEQHNEEDVAGAQGAQNQQIKQQAPSMQQYTQNMQNMQNMPQRQMFGFQFPMQPLSSLQIKNPPYIQYPQMMTQQLPQQLQQYKNYPFFPQAQMYQSFPFIQNQQPPIDPQQFSNTVSKELQTKVYMIIQQVSVSSFQCNCKKSKCLKLYCECFANGQVCSQSCNCLDCKNRIDNPQERQKAIEEALIRNNDAFNSILNGKTPAAYQPPVPTDQVQQFKAPQKDEKLSLTKNSAQNRVRKGCNCKKSNCKKKYCECYSASLGCTDLCKCENCYNRKGTDGNREDDQRKMSPKEEDAKEQEDKKVRNKKVKKEECEQPDNKIQIKMWKKPKKSPSS